MSLLDTVFGKAEIKYRRLFPDTASIPSSGAKLTINADGTWSGDGVAFLRAIEEAQAPPYAETNNKLIMWLVARAVRQDMGTAVGD